jgi:hypothetical protein
MRAAFDFLIVLALGVALWLYARLIAYYDGRPRKAASGPAFGVFAPRGLDADASRQPTAPEPSKTAGAPPSSQRPPSKAATRG